MSKEEKTLLWIAIKQILRNQQMLLIREKASYDEQCTVNVLHAIEESDYIEPSHKLSIM